MAKINLSGYIGDLGATGTDVAALLENTADTLVEITVNSTGGDAFSGLQICDALMAWKISGEGRRIETTVTGHCMSAASVAIMPSDTITAYPNASFMIHRASVDAWGNVDELGKAIELLAGLDSQIGDVYRTYRNIDITADGQAKDLFLNDKVFNAEKAVEIGLADSITQLRKADAKGAMANITNYLKSPERMDLLTKITNLFKDHGVPTAEGEADAAATNVAHALADGTVHSADDTLAVGSVVYVDEIGGELAPDAVHTLADGRTFTTVGGAITEISDAPDNAAIELETLRAENAALKAEIGSAKATTAAALAENAAKLKKQESFIADIRNAKAEFEKKAPSAANSGDDRDIWFGKATGKIK